MGNPWLRLATKLTATGSTASLSWKTYLCPVPLTQQCSSGEQRTQASRLHVFRNNVYSSAQCVLYCHMSILRCGMTCNVWNNAGQPRPITGFNQHTDYVNCLAAAKSRAVVVSAGLRAEVFLWDVQKAISTTVQVITGTCTAVIGQLVYACFPILGLQAVVNWHPASGIPCLLEML